MLLCTSCQKKVEHGGKTPIAQVGNRYLYQEDLAKALPYGLSASDSARLAGDLTRQWVEEQVLYEKAQHNVSKDGHIEQLVADYRQKLIMNDYEQRLVKQKMNEEVTEAELLEYYEDNKVLFVLEEAVIKGVFIKVPRKASGLKELKKWYKNNSEEAMEQMEKYAFRNAVMYEYFYDRWMPVSELEGKIVVNLAELSKDFGKNPDIEVEDDEYCYLLHVEEFVAEGEAKPYDLAKSDIMDLLANARRVEFMRKVREDLYNQAMEKGRVKYFNNEAEVMGDTIRGANGSTHGSAR